MTDAVAQPEGMSPDFAYVWSVAAEAFQPDAAVTVSEWSDAHRVLSSKASAEAGPWRTIRTPYLREIMDSLSSYSTVETVAVQKGAQVGLSECGLNFCGYVIHHAPGPALYVMPTVEMAQKLSKTRLQPMISASPSLLERIPPSRSGDKDAGNSQLSKDFPGGVLMLTGANSASGLRSMPIRYLVLDEVDAYPASADDEGDPVNLAIKRTANFVRRKIFALSTPGVKGFSRIAKMFANGDQRYFCVACDECGEVQPFRWRPPLGPDRKPTEFGGVRWPKGRPDLAMWQCAGCGHEHAEHRKIPLMEAGSWVATAEAKRPGLRSYHVSSLYSPWQTWAECAQQFMDCHGDDGRPDPSLLQVFVNTVLGEEWEDISGERVDADGLIGKTEDWGPILPAKVAVLTAGIDVQDDRIEVETVGWGADEESWSIETEILTGDPAQTDIWDRLDAVLDRKRAHPGYPKGISVQASCIDTGGSHTARVYAWAHARSHRKIWAIKGSKEYRAPVWPKRPSRTRKSGGNFYMVGVSAAKETIYKRLTRVGPTASGAGACHFGKDWDLERFGQLTAEVKRIKYLNGHPVPYWWKQDGKRNEALDCRVYSYAALQSLIAMGLRLNAHAMVVAAKVAEAVREGIAVKAIPLEHQATTPAPIAPATADDADQVPAVATPVPVAVPVRKAKRRIRSSPFMR